MASALLQRYSAMVPFESVSKRVAQVAQKFGMKADSRTASLPMMHPLTPLAVCAAYLLTIAILSALMRQRSRPFQCKWLAMLHNVNMTCMSTYMFVEIIRQCFVLNHYSLFGNDIDRSKRGNGLAHILYIFYLSKMFEFVDTVYHHSSIFVIWWMISLYAPGGESYFSAMLNSFIHILMYSYYLWTSLSSKPQPGQRPNPFQPAFYKKYITKLQLTQFTLMMIQACYDLFICDRAKLGSFPIATIWLLAIYMCTMLALFGNFYLQAYKSKGTSKRQAKKLE